VLSCSCLASRKHKPVTLMDVARASGYSASSVSIVLNDAPLAENLNPHTRRRIREFAERLGYRPHVFARSLRTQRSNTIGVIVFDMSDPFCTLILRGIDNYFQPAGFLPIVMDAHNDRSRFERYLDMVVQRRVEGLIVVANWLFVSIDALKQLALNRLPTVVVGRDLHRSGVRSVLVDNERGGYMALRHLYELGHRKVNFLLGPKQLSDSSRRWAGMQRFAAQAGLEIARSRVLQLPGLSDPLTGFSSGAELTRKWLHNGHKFTAIAAFDDMTAFGAIRGLSHRGLKVPNDCSVIGFDDVPMAELYTPGLTTIRQPMEPMGKYAAEVVGTQISQGSVRKGGEPLRLLEPELVMRQSTAALEAR
jgi:LacI family transcriptional regulator, galactose operon repressor